MAFSVDGRHNKGTAVYHRDLQKQFRGNMNAMVEALRFHIQEHLGSNQWTLEKDDVIALLNKYECGEILQACRNIKEKFRKTNTDMSSFYPEEIIDALYSGLERVANKSGEGRKAA